jgi:hypothetical protein
VFVASFVGGVACTRHTTTTAAEGERVVAAVGDRITVGELALEVRGDNGEVRLSMHEGARSDSRLVAGRRVVKFGAHLIELEAVGRSSAPSVAVEVKAYQPAVPLTPADARLAADEALSPRSQGTVVCSEGTPSTDGKAFRVRCRDDGASDSDTTVTIDAVTDAVLSVRGAGGA